MSTPTGAPVRSLLARLGRRVAAAPVVRNPRLRRLPRPGAVTLVATALIVLQLLLRSWAASRSWFMWDDYIFIADVTRGDVSFSWLFRSHFSLIQPVGFAMVALVGLAGFSWSVYAVHILVLQLLASVACWAMLRIVFGDRRILLLPLALYLLSPLTVPASVWWSVAIYQYPFHIALFGAITCHVVWLRRRTPWPLIGTLAFTALGLGSYLKAPLILPLLLAISLLWFTRGSTRDRAREIARQWPAWTGLIALVVGYVALWSSRQDVAPPTRACEALGVTQISVLETIATGLLGGPWQWRPWTAGVDPAVAGSACVPVGYLEHPDLVLGGVPQSLASPPLALIALSWVALVLLVAQHAARWRGAMRGLVIAVPYTAASVALVFVGRAATFGSEVSGREVRYFADLAVIACFVVAAALVPMRGALSGPTRREDPLLTVGPHRTLVTTAVVFFVAGSLVSTVGYASPWHAKDDAERFPERAYVAAVERSLDARDGGTAVVADLPLPSTVANPVINPYNLPSRKLAPLAPRLTTTDQGSDLEMLAADGAIVPAAIREESRAEPGEVPDCGYLVQQERTAIAVAPVVPGAWWVQLDYLASDDGFVDVTAGEMFRRVPVEAGLHRLLFESVGDFEQVEIVASSEVSVCVDAIRVGFPVPVERDGGTP